MWFSSYLSDRYQLVESGTRSSTKNITCGVPQGSILGPLLFLIYVNDMSKYLGVTIDQCLSFESMARAIIKKSNARLKFLYRKQSCLNQYTMKLLVMSLIQCHFDYASSVWSNTGLKTQNAGYTE